MIRVFDLFAGAGGLSLGFQLAGAQIIQAVEVDAWACESFAANFPSTRVECRDVATISSAEFRDLGEGSKIDVIIGGPPCQGFSHSNAARRDPKDPRNSLFLEFLRAVDAMQPKAFVIENVTGLLTTIADERPVIDIIAAAFSSIGYRISFKVLDAVHFGVPQRRERLFIVGFRDTNDYARYEWPDATHFYDPTMPDATMNLFAAQSLNKLLPAVTLWDAISDLPNVSAGSSDLPAYQGSPHNDYQQAMRADAPLQISNHEPMKHTARIVERFATIGFGQSEQHAPELLKPRKRGDVSSLSDKVYSQNSRRQLPDRPCNTIVASSHTNFIHPFLHRNFTIRELLRIQSFPDKFVLRGKRAVLSARLLERKKLYDDMHLDQRVQVGNAVPPQLALHVAVSVQRALDRRGLARNVA